jgi:hypothetical protein|tara:strand:+ start:596 stop:1699 length:1104 start_codon:yes stop_codon:yes gene_type:complete
MAITYNAGRRIQTTSAEFGTNGAGIPAVSGGWVELGRTTLGAADTNIEVSSLPDKRYYMVLSQGLENPSVTYTQPGLRLGSGSVDSGSSYSQRYSDDGATDSTNNNAGYVIGWANKAAPQYDGFNIAYISNTASKEKLILMDNLSGQASGAGNAPSRMKVTGKWRNVTNPLDTVNMFNAGGTDAFNTGSEVVVLGWDEDDTHTTNFWEELSSTTLGSAGDSISSGSLTAKKYYNIQAWTKNSGAAAAFLRLGSTSIDSGSNYAVRRSLDGAADSAFTSQTELNLDVSTTTGFAQFYNIFIINNASSEKLVIVNAVGTNTAGAGTAPQRLEAVGKWSNTSNQADIIELVNTQAGSFDTGSIMKVWGSN